MISPSEGLKSQTTLKGIKDKVLDLLNKEIISENDITKASMSLREYPSITIEVEEKLVNEESFEMLKQSKINPIFTMNLQNIIMIANFVWNAVKKIFI